MGLNGTAPPIPSRRSCEHLPTAAASSAAQTAPTKAKGIAT